MFGKFGSLDRNKDRSSKSSTPKSGLRSSNEIAWEVQQDVQRILKIITPLEKGRTTAKMSTAAGGTVSVTSSKSSPSAIHQITAKRPYRESN